MSSNWIPVDFTKPRDEWPECLYKWQYFEIVLDHLDKPIIGFWSPRVGKFIRIPKGSTVTHIKPITLSEPPQEVKS